ncbi:MAG: histidine kinase [Lachnospiraceae bacterium]|nr:histidine kinase [Lachnospiraceae bacterium]
MGLTVSDYFLGALEMWGAVLCVVAALFTLFSKKTNPVGYVYMMILQLICAVMMFSDVLACFSMGSSGMSGYICTRLGYFLCFSLAYLCLYFFAVYFNCFVEKNAVNIIGSLFVKLFSIAGVLLVVLNLQFKFYYSFDVQNWYHREKYFWLVQSLTILPFLVFGILIVYNRKKLGYNKCVAFFSYIIFPAISVITTVISYSRVSTLNLGIALSIFFMMAVIMMEQRKDIFQQRGELLRKEEELVKQERKINEMQIRLVISQIQPHFLYNALNSIYYLCEKNTSMAQEAINNFSNYLRGNMDALRSTTPVDFSVELNHVENYLALEKMRFEDELEVILDIETTDFKIPALCLQPVVENAVKHGVGKKIDGGTVTIRTREMSDSYEIIVEDDGVGFDTKKKKKDGRSHIGIDNVHNRLKEMVGGDLKMISTPGIGTVAVLHIPKNATHPQYD